PPGRLAWPGPAIRASSAASSSRPASRRAALEHARAGLQQGPFMSTQARPRRSVLYMPGANVRALEKAKTIAADALILDLEDAVAPDAKAQARDNVVKALAE